MKKQIPWPYLIFGGLILHCVDYLGGGVITSAIGVLGDLLFLFGIIEFFRTRKKGDKES
jgi:hypothetical protein